MHFFSHSFFWQKSKNQKARAEEEEDSRLDNLTREINKVREAQHKYRTSQSVY